MTNKITSKKNKLCVTKTTTNITCKYTLYKLQNNRKQTKHKKPTKFTKRTNKSFYKLPKTKMIGGAIDTNMIKYITDFKLDDYGLYLNPIYGLLASKALIPKIYNFGDGIIVDNMFYNFVRVLFIRNGYDIVPSKSDCFGRITASQIGYIIGKLYIENVYRPDIFSNSLSGGSPSGNLVGNMGSSELVGNMGSNELLEHNLQSESEISGMTDLEPYNLNFTASEINIFEKINAKFFEKINKKTRISAKNITNINLFHAILAFFWMRENASDELFEYFKGLHYIFDKTLNTEKYKHEPTLNSILLALKTILTRKSTLPNNIINTIISEYHEEIRVISSGNINIDDNIKFADCFETTIRNFINYLVFQQKIKKELLHLSIQNYYTIYNTMQLQENDNKFDIDINGERRTLSSREAWGLILSNIDSVDVDYAKHSNSFKYELYSSIKNFINILLFIFDKTSFSDVVKLLKDKCNLTISIKTSKKYGDIDIILYSDIIATLNIFYGHAFFSPPDKSKKPHEIDKIDMPYYLDDYISNYISNIKHNDLDLNSYGIPNFFYKKKKFINFF